MINLLPPQGKKHVLFEYWIRVLAAYLFLLGISALVLTVLFLPAYFLIVFQKDVYQNQYGATADLERLEHIEEEFATANLISDLLLDTKHYLPANAVLAVLFELSSDQVQVEAVQVAKEEGAVSQLTFTGIADNRESLIGFRDRLKEHEYFAEVNLPISDLTRNENISFSMSVTPAEVVTQPLAYEDII